jgi:hypothetical protein
LRDSDFFRNLFSRDTEKRGRQSNQGFDAWEKHLVARAVTIESKVTWPAVIGHRPVSA